MKRLSSWLVVLALVVGLATTFAARAASARRTVEPMATATGSDARTVATHGDHEGEGRDEDDDLDPGETRVKLEDLPAAAKATILKEAGQAKLEELKSLVKDGKTTYEACYEIAEDQDVELTVAADGTLLAKAIETDIALDKLPEAVKQTVLKEAGHGKVEEVKSVLCDGVTTYEAMIETAADQDVELTVDQHGKVLAREVQARDGDEGDDKEDDDD